ncbi:helix-turn-helix domain-containing protein [Gordonia sp. ABSL49_1]|uniref:helix-turn-helix domain-containing protein n=1 Tax=Gordonia sp. ABSL49_1 TaxID=2920941 RepID=UPI001F10274B|nr:helix-turn-helix domain-containing protein [Gordonia sp. ABSL49_1]MCH5645678.1 helix-turn-helix domain-containing protein [Gordonia sp. ABSL49_1]
MAHDRRSSVPAKPEPARRYNKSAAQIADEFGVHPRTVRRWLAEGRITGRRVGPRVIRFDANEVAAQLLGGVGGAA